jgi:hypothetical protein
MRQFEAWPAAVTAAISDVFGLTLNAKARDHESDILGNRLNRGGGLWQAGSRTGKTR